MKKGNFQMNVMLAPDSSRPVGEPPSTTVAGYLLARLAEARVRSIFGVPGDYNLGILDAIAGRRDLAWIGTATEQGAGYAADGYARLRGLGAIVTTFGVGELSAIQRDRRGGRPAAAEIAGRPDDEPGADRAPVTQRRLWRSVQRFLRPGDLVLADQGTAFYGAAELSLPEQARLIGQPLWASIGWTLPAALGAALAEPDRRIVLIAGDGALQQTAPELGPLLSQGIAPVVIVINNDGYAVERAIHHPDAAYHDVPAWRWTILPGTVSADRHVIAVRASTPAALEEALAMAAERAGPPVLIEVVLGKADTPPLLTELTKVLATRASLGTE
jgi:TPP-dependent 2-oxoacid decarboxylase